MTFNGDLPHLQEPKENVPTDILVTSSNLFLWIPSKTLGYEVPYPCITLHAIESALHSVYMQIELGSELLEISVVTHNPNDVQVLYESLSQCSSLHPDVVSDDEQYGGEPVEADWITEDLEQGDADDVVGSTNGYGQEDAGSAGLEVEIENQHVQQGSRRTRNEIEEDDEEDVQKWRKTN